MQTNEFAPKALPLYHPLAGKDLLLTVAQAMKDRAPKMLAQLQRGAGLWRGRRACGSTRRIG